MTKSNQALSDAKENGLKFVTVAYSPAGAKGSRLIVRAAATGALLGKIPFPHHTGGGTAADIFAVSSLFGIDAARVRPLFNKFDAAATLEILGETK
jgi:hypothetical protein